MSEQPLNFEQTPVDLPDGTEAYFHAGRDDLLPYEKVQNTKLEVPTTPEVPMQPHEVIGAQAYWLARFRKEDVDLAA